MDPITICSSATWKSAFLRQATAETLRAATRCAAGEIARLQRLEIEPPFDEDDLVQQVMAATCAGALTWDPDRVPLRTHLRDALRLVCRRLRVRGAGDEGLAGGPAIPVALDDLDDEDTVWSEDAMVVPSPAETLMSAQVVHHFESELWLRSAGDQVVLRVLRAMADGDTTPADVAESTGLPVAVVVAARRRLTRTARQIPPELMSALRAERSGDGSTDQPNETREPDAGTPFEDVEAGGRDAGQAEGREADGERGLADRDKRRPRRRSAGARAARRRL